MSPTRKASNSCMKPQLIIASIASLMLWELTDKWRDHKFQEPPISTASDQIIAKICQLFDETLRHIRPTDDTVGWQQSQRNRELGGEEGEHLRRKTC